MSWWAVVPDALVLALLVLLPGALALRLLGLRGLAALAAAPPVTLTAIGVLSVLFAPLGVAWRLPAVLAGLAVMLAALAGAVWAVGRLRPAGRARAAGRVPGGDGGAHRAGLAGHRDGRADGGPWHPLPLGRRPALAVAAAVVAGIVLLAVPFVAALPSPDAPLQQWDGVFHLNALGVARETRVVGPLGGLAPLYGGGTLAPYYPTRWH